MTKTVVILESSALIAQINGKDIGHQKADEIATSNLYGTREIFGFDAAFPQNGYSLPGHEERQAA